MKILVTGGRKYGNRKLVYEILDKLQPLAVVQGGATGADELARDWCDEHRSTCEKLTYKVTDEEWRKLGKKAGPLRNQRMLDEEPDIDMVVAFPGNTGTADMVRRARAADIKVLEVDDED